MYISERTVNGETTAEVRYFIGSKKSPAKYDGQGLRNHWGIENLLHWQLDVTFGEDGNRVQRRNGAENLALLRRLTLVLLKAHPAEMSLAKNATLLLSTQNFSMKSSAEMAFWRNGDAFALQQGSAP